MKKQLTLLFFCFAFSRFAYPQQFLVNHYNSKNFDANPIMWDFVQDFYGRYWFANNDGVVRFDGSSWNKFNTPNAVRSLVFNKRGDLFLACKGDFGLIKFSSNGGWEYISLKEKFNFSKPLNGDEKICCVDDVIYFISRNHIFRIIYKGSDYKIQDIESRTILGGFEFNHQFYCNVAKEGLSYFQGNKLLLVKNGELLKNDMVISTTHYLNSLLLVTSRDEFYLLKNNTLSRMDLDLPKEGLKEIISIASFDQSKLAIGTMHHGVFLMDLLGKSLVNNYLPNLPSTEIYNLKIDQDNNLWVSHAKGMSQVLLNVPIQELNHLKIDGRITSIEELNGTLYLGTLSGIVIFNPINNSTSKLKGIDGECWDLAKYGDAIFTASTNGIFVIKNNVANLLLADETILHFQFSAQDNSLYALGENGCWRVGSSGSAFSITKIPDLNELVNSIVKNEDGTYWVGSYYNGLLKLNDKKFDKAELPNDLKTGKVNIREYDGQILFQSKSNVYLLKGNKFEPNPHLNNIFLQAINKVFKKGKDLYVITSAEIKKFENEKRIPSFLNAMNGTPSVVFIHQDNVYAGIDDKLYKCQNHANLKREPTASFTSICNNSGQVIYAGFFVDKNGETKAVQESEIQLDYHELPIKIEFGVSDALNPAKNRFRYRIQSFSENWSDWSNQSFLVLNGISGGKLTIELEVQSPSGIVSQTASLMIHIKPPFYLSGLAYLIYLSFLLLMMVLIVWIYNKRLVNKNNALEKKVEERTADLNAEKKVSEDLLLNILPLNVVQELKETGHSKAKLYTNVTVLFTDFVNFTGISQTLSPSDLVAEIHNNFSHFDRIIEMHHLEKIKTIGDAYMAVCGLPKEDGNHALNVVYAAIDICKWMKENNGKFEVRIGIHSGPVVAGIVGVKKYAFDIWGDTVNTAARMEQNSMAGKINISQATYDLVKDQFLFHYRGKIQAKNKGEVDMYFVEV